jgi:cystathionine beta-synthase
MYYNSIIETIGNTPLVKLRKVTRNIKGTILAKLEYFNPGNSMKDRMAVKMIEEAEKSGDLKPGGTIIEGTSGNTGMGLALTAIAKGYQCIFTLADKQSREKIDILRAMGAEVIVCPTNVAPEDPKSYYSVAKKLNKEMPNSYYVNQYDNLSNSQAHYESTGPEIWDDTEGKITHFVAGVGTGGSISGVGRYLKEKNKNIKAIGIDSYGSVFKKYKDTGLFDEKEIYPYLTEGIGEDILPENVNFEVIDEFIKVTDKDAAIMARRLAREEGLFIGWSCGSAVFGALEYARIQLNEDDLMVILLPDHGTRYLNKIFNDNWMKDHGYLEEREFATARDILKKQGIHQQLVTISVNMRIDKAILVMNQSGISQVPVIDEDQIVGTITDSSILKHLIENPEIKNEKVKEIMDDPLPFVAMDSTVDVLSSLIDKKITAVLVRDENHRAHIITQHDILMAMTS